ncbi:unnamed protein product [Angiostrongylus costaricensis]|uniref:Bestrophin homolog n=1 Tax=Angiostrongylus costaricensis TaxID=334426 RepID=A0A0R3PRB9_ANGCS|nr:unnamed protein product [Angiostrongylus costaricensis]
MYCKRITCICISDPSFEDLLFKDSETWVDEFVIPVFAIYEFIFFVGWLKVAQVMLNPFGMDDDDFDIDMLVERNLQVTSFLLLNYVLYQSFSMTVL